jgi:heme/copper-type cytochrome/quinol oxidase subunit 2
MTLSPKSGRTLYFFVSFVLFVYIVSLVSTQFVYFVYFCRIQDTVRQSMTKWDTVLKVTVVWQLNQRYQKWGTPRRPELATSWEHKIGS